METASVTLLPLEQPRTVLLTVGKTPITFDFRPLSDKDWRRFLESIVARVEVKDGQKTSIDTEHPALAELAQKALLRVNGETGKSVPPRLLIAAGMALRSASAEIVDADLLSEFTTVSVSATWSLGDGGKMIGFEGLKHSFKQPTIDQLRRYKMGAARVITTGTAQDGATIYPSRLATALSLYDELIAEVEGYGVDGKPVTEVAAIRSYMDGYHKAIAVYELFERSSDAVWIGPPEVVTDESGTAEDEQ